MNDLLIAKAQFQLSGILLLIQAEKEGWDKDPPWVARGKDGRFGGGGSAASKAIKKAKGEVEKYLSDLQPARDRLYKEFQNASKENRKKVLTFISSDGAEDAKQFVAKTLDEYLPGAGKSFKEAVDEVDRALIAEDGPINRVLGKDIGRLRRKLLGHPTIIDKGKDTADAVGRLVAEVIQDNVILTALATTEGRTKVLDNTTKDIDDYFKLLMDSYVPEAIEKIGKFSQKAVKIGVYGIYIFVITPHLLRLLMAMGMRGNTTELPLVDDAESVAEASRLEAQHRLQVEETSKKLKEEISIAMDKMLGLYEGITDDLSDEERARHPK